MNIDNIYQAITAGTQAVNNLTKNVGSIAAVFTGGTVKSEITSVPTVNVEAAQVYPKGGNGLVGASGNLANTLGTASLAGITGKLMYLTGVRIYGAGATAASNVTATISGLSGTTLSFTLAIPAGATTAITPLIFEPPYAIPASIASGSITLLIPAFGSGNINASGIIYGFYI